MLLAYQTPERQQAWVETMLDEGSEPKAIQSFLEDIRQTAASGYHRAPSVFVDAITDLGVPIFDGVSQGPAASLWSLMSPGAQLTRLWTKRFTTSSRPLPKSVMACVTGKALAATMMTIHV